MLMDKHKALCWQDFDTVIVKSQKQGEKAGCPSALIPPALVYTKGKMLPSGSSISASAWPDLSPFNEMSSLCGKMKQYGSRSAGLGQALQADLTALHWNIHEVASMESQRQKPASDPWAEPSCLSGTPSCSSPGWVWQVRSLSPSATDCGTLLGLWWALQVMATNQIPPGRISGSHAEAPLNWEDSHSRGWG